MATVEETQEESSLKDGTIQPLPVLGEAKAVILLHGDNNGRRDDRPSVKEAKIEHNQSDSSDIRQNNGTDGRNGSHHELRENSALLGVPAPVPKKSLKSSQSGTNLFFTIS